MRSIDSRIERLLRHAMRELPCPTCGKRHVIDLSALDNWDEDTYEFPFCCCPCCRWFESMLDSEFARLVTDLVAEGINVADLIEQWPS